MLEQFEDRLRHEIATAGPLPFSRFVDLALYDPDFGFYATTGRAGGRHGDFVTSAEVGPLFAAVVADWLDQQWHSAGCPESFLVSEVGAGVGTLFRGIVRAAPACLSSITYTLVERSAAMQVAHQSLPGEQWRSSAQLPAERQHVVLANELLDNLSFDIAERVAAGWAPARVGAVDAGLRFEVGPADPALAFLDALAPDAVEGTRVPVAVTASAWVDQAVASAHRVLAFDYGATTAELAVRDQAGWLRTYAAHGRGSNPLIDVGRRDITHDVPIDQLRSPQLHMSQADWLRANGIEQRVVTARATWKERAHIGDLQAIAARSAVGEAEALTDPSGLGGFVALEWGS